MGVRLVTEVGELARRGFVESARAVANVRRLEAIHYDGTPDLVEVAATTIDPDQALAALADLCDAHAAGHAADLAAVREKWGTA